MNNKDFAINSKKTFTFAKNYGTLIVMRLSHLQFNA